MVNCPIATFHHLFNENLAAEDGWPVRRGSPARHVPVAGTASELASVGCVILVRGRCGVSAGA